MTESKSEGGGFWWDHRVSQSKDLFQITSVYTLGGGYYEYSVQKVKIDTGAFAGKNHAKVYIHGKDWNDINQHITTGGENLIEAYSENTSNWQAVRSNQWTTFGKNYAFYKGFDKIELGQRNLGGYNQAEIDGVHTSNIRQEQYIGGYNSISLKQSGATIFQWAQLGYNEIKGVSGIIRHVKAEQRALASYNNFDMAGHMTGSIDVQQASYVGGYNRIYGGGGTHGAEATINQYCSGGGNEFYGRHSWYAINIKQHANAGANIFEHKYSTSNIKATQNLYAAGANILKIKEISGNGLKWHWNGDINQYNTLGFNEIKIEKFTKGRLYAGQVAAASFNTLTVGNIQDAWNFKIVQKGSISGNKIEIKKGKVGELNVDQLLLGAGYNGIFLNELNQYKKSNFNQHVHVVGGVNQFQANKNIIVDASIGQYSVSTASVSICDIKDTKIQRLHLDQVGVALGSVMKASIEGKVYGSGVAGTVEIVAVGGGASALVHSIKNIAKVVVVQVAPVSGVCVAVINESKDGEVIQYVSLGVNVAVLNNKSTYADKNLQVSVCLLGGAIQVASVQDGNNCVQVAVTGGGAGVQISNGFQDVVQISFAALGGSYQQAIYKGFGDKNHSIVQISVQGAGVGSVQIATGRGDLTQVSLIAISQPGIIVQVATNSGVNNHLIENSKSVQIAGLGGAVFQYSELGYTAIQVGFGIAGVIQIINNPHSKSAVQVGAGAAVTAQVIVGENLETAVQVAATAYGANAQVVIAKNESHLAENHDSTVVQLAGNQYGANLQLTVIDDGVVVQLAGNQYGGNVQVAIMRDGVVVQGAAQQGGLLTQVAVLYKGVVVQVAGGQKSAIIQVAILDSGDVVQISGCQNGAVIQVAKADGVVVQGAGLDKGVIVQVAVDATVHVAVAGALSKGSCFAVHVKDGHAVSVHVMGSALKEVSKIFSDAYEAFRAADKPKSNINNDKLNKDMLADNSKNNAISSKYKENIIDDAKNKKFSSSQADKLSGQDYAAAHDKTANAYTPRMQEYEEELSYGNRARLNYSNDLAKSESSNSSLGKGLQSNFSQSSDFKLEKQNYSASPSKSELNRIQSQAKKSGATHNVNNSISSNSNGAQVSGASNSEHAYDSIKPSQQKSAESLMKNDFGKDGLDSAAKGIEAKRFTHKQNVVDNFTKVVDLKVIKEEFGKLKDRIVNGGGGINVSVTIHDGIAVKLMLGIINISVDVKTSDENPTNRSILVLAATNMNFGIIEGRSDDVVVALNEGVFETIASLKESVSLFTRVFTNLETSKFDPKNIVLLKSYSAKQKASIEELDKAVSANNNGDEDALKKIDMNKISIAKFSSLAEWSKLLGEVLGKIVGTIMIDITKSNFIYSGDGSDVVVSVGAKSIINAGTGKSFAAYDINHIYAFNTGGVSISTEDIVSSITRLTSNDTALSIAYPNAFKVLSQLFIVNGLRMDFLRYSGSIESILNFVEGLDGKSDDERSAALIEKFLTGNIEVLLAMPNLGALSGISAIFKLGFIASGKDYGFDITSRQGSLFISDAEMHAFRIGAQRIGFGLEQITSAADVINPAIQGIGTGFNSLLTQLPSTISNWVQLAQTDSNENKENFLRNIKDQLGNLIVDLNILGVDVNTDKALKDAMAVLTDSNVIVSISKSNLIFTGGAKGDTTVTIAFGRVLEDPVSSNKEGEFASTAIFGSAGNDIIIAVGDLIQIYSGDGDDVIVALGKDIQIEAGGGNDVAIGLSTLGLRINGGAGDDVIVGLQGLDYNADKSKIGAALGMMIGGGSGVKGDIIAYGGNAKHVIKTGDGSSLVIDILTDNDQGFTDLRTSGSGTYLLSSHASTFLRPYAKLSTLIKQEVKTGTTYGDDDDNFIEIEKFTLGSYVYGLDGSDVFLNRGVNSHVWAGEADADTFLLSCFDYKGEIMKNSKSEFHVSSMIVNDVDLTVDKIVIDAGVSAAAFYWADYDALVVAYTATDYILKNDSLRGSDFSFAIFQNAQSQLDVDKRASFFDENFNLLNIHVSKTSLAKNNVWQDKNNIDLAVGIDSVSFAVLDNVERDLVLSNGLLTDNIVQTLFQSNSSLIFSPL